MSDELKSALLGATVSIVRGILNNQQSEISDLPGLLVNVHGALDVTAKGSAAESQKPAANLRRLVAFKTLRCADCGRQFKTMKRHLGAAHGLTPAAYLAKWGLSSHHPMVAANYSVKRAELSRLGGFGSNASPQLGQTIVKGAVKAG